jgi:hypothetical protein
LWITGNEIELQKEPNVNKLTIKATKSDDDNNVARMDFMLDIKPFNNTSEFCEKFMCFYNFISFNVLEHFNDTHKALEIGELAPRFYRKICNRNYQANYEVLNGKIEI